MPDVRVDGKYVVAEVRGVNVRVRLRLDEPELCFKRILKVYEEGGLKLSCEERTELLKQFNAALEPLYASKDGGEGSVEHTIPAEVLSEAERRAEEILSSDNPLQKLKEECLDHIITGEDENKKLLTILLLSGKYAKVEPNITQIIILGGQPGVGKSELANLSRAFAVKEVGRFTAHALDYTNLSGFEVLYIKEMASLDVEKEGVATIKFLSTEDKGYIVEYVVRDGDGRLTTETKRIPPITVVTTTTKVQIDPQLERRAWILNPDESVEQTKRILEFKSSLKEEEQLVKMGLKNITSKEFAFQILKAILRKLEPVKVVVPYTKTLADLLNSSVLRSRSDYDKIYALIILTAFFLQRKLPRLSDGLVLATPSVIIHALDMAAEPLSTMSTKLDRRIRSLVQELYNLGKKDADTVIYHEDRVKIAKKLCKNERTIRNYLKKMVEEGYVIEEPDQADRRQIAHRLIKSLDEIIAASTSLKFGGDSGSREFPISIMQKAYHETIDFLQQYCGNDLVEIREKVKADIVACLAAFPSIDQAALSKIFGSDEAIDEESRKTRLPEPLPEQRPKLCSCCKFWSKNSCVKHPEWVVVLPTTPTCALFEQRGEDEGARHLPPAMGS
jgi:DNA-binding MarR family transcriptional regulator